MDSNVIKLVLDCVDLENDGLAALRQRSREGGVELTVLDPSGPAGGNPVVEVAGTRHALLGWLVAEYVNGDATQAELMLDDAAGE